MNNIHAVGLNSKDELILYLKKLSKNDIESYDFTHKIIELINGCGKSIHGWLAEILTESNLSDIDDIEQKNYVFAVYYALTYYFKRYDKADKLKKALDEYYDIFEYAILREEIASWYYRKIGDLKKAYIYDKNLILKLDIHTNAVPFISYASTISKMLEDEINKTLFKEPLSNWNNINEMTAEWELAIKYMRAAIEQYYVIRNGRNYGKHSFLYGKLVAFNPNIVKQSISELNKTYDEALVYFNKAIEYENENEEDYYKRCDEYRQYQNKCLILKIQLIMTINDSKVSEQLSNLDQLESQIKKLPEKYIALNMEMLAIFSAIIAIILGGLNFTDKMTVFESLLVVTSLSAVCSFFISILSIILFEEKKRKISITLAVLSFAIIFVMLICAWSNK